MRQQRRKRDTDLLPLARAMPGRLLGGAQLRAGRARQPHLQTCETAHVHGQHPARAACTPATHATSAHNLCTSIPHDTGVESQWLWADAH